MAFRRSRKSPVHRVRNMSTYPICIPSRAIACIRSRRETPLAVLTCRVVMRVQWLWIDMASNIPPPYIIKNEQIVFHEDGDRSGYMKPFTPENFCYDDHNFDNVMIDDDHFENPYSTSNIQDILRNHRYTLNPDEQDGMHHVDDNILPPLKLANMNTLVDLMYERCIESKEEYLLCEKYKATHPSVFGWEKLSQDAVEMETTIDGEKFLCNEEEGKEGVPQKNENKEIIGDLYLDTQVISM